MQKLRRVAVAVACMLTCACICAQQAPSPAYKLITGNSFVESKNYYLLTLFEQLPDVKRMLENDPVLSALAAKKQNEITFSLKACNNEAACFTEKMKYTDQEIKETGERLSSLYTPENALGRLVRQHLVPSGTYILFHGLPPAQLLAKAWEQDARGINFTIGVYAEGKKANYPNIDSASLPVRDSRYGGFVYTAAYLLSNECSGNRLFFCIPLAAALHFLEMNERGNAADYEPMAATVNKPAFDKIRSVQWSRYTYSVILVPGAGPDSPAEALSAEGMLRCRLAALQYAKGMAPFIVVSGGKVHPYKTRYNEAMEMKAFLLQLHIPESAIIVEPHARHTTTNMRNCARLIFRYGIPFTMPCLATTSRLQSLAIATTLTARCQAELHEVPYKNGARLSETETAFFPLIEALQLNPAEPIDP